MSDQDKLTEVYAKIKELECRIAELQREQDQIYELLNISGENDQKLAETVNKILDIMMDQYPAVGNLIH
jgi:hypothetical protein